MTLVGQIRSSAKPAVEKYRERGWTPIFSRKGLDLTQRPIFLPHERSTSDGYTWRVDISVVSLRRNRLIVADEWDPVEDDEWYMRWRNVKEKKTKGVQTD